MHATVFDPRNTAGLTQEGDKHVYVISGFRYGFLGTADSNIAVGAIVLLLVNTALGILCYGLIRSGWKLKN